VIFRPLLDLAAYRRATRAGGGDLPKPRLHSAGARATACEADLCPRLAYGLPQMSAGHAAAESSIMGQGQWSGPGVLDTTLFLCPEYLPRIAIHFRGSYMAVKTIRAPIPGIFYRRPAPDQPPFKNDGDSIAVGDTVGLIEVMKTFTPVAAEEAGQNARFLVENEEAIMAGQPLVEVEG
jgi:acetyl-CoA carboxylase biotin carboxyl carrier protein